MAVNTLRRGLNRETRALLEYIQRERPANLAYGKPAQTVIAQAHATIDRVIASSGLAHLVVDELHWFMDDLARALVAGQGEELVFELEGLLGKWLAYDLEPNTVQLLLRILLRNLAGIDTPKTENSESRIQRPESRVSGPEGEITAKSAKTDKKDSLPRRHEEHEVNPGSGTGPLESSSPGTLPVSNDGRKAEAGDAEAGHD